MENDSNMTIWFSSAMVILGTVYITKKY